MKATIRKFIHWVMNDNANRPTALQDCIASGNSTTPAFRVGVVKAMNGRILELSTYKHNPHGPDWTTEMFIVPEDQTLTQALTTVLTVKGLHE